MKIAFLFNKRNPTVVNAMKVKKARRELNNAQPKEQQKYIQGQLDKIGNSLEDR